MLLDPCHRSYQDLGLCLWGGGGGDKTKEISMKNIGVTILITNRKYNWKIYDTKKPIINSIGMRIEKPNIQLYWRIEKPNIQLYWHED